MENKADFYYKKNINNLLNFGVMDKNPRPKYKDGTPAHSLFITQVFEEYNINEGEFPITTLRNTAIKTGIKEIFWIYQKQNNLLSDAKNLGIHWWDNWDIGDGTIGQRYGATVKRYDLINKLLYNLKNNPFSRRHVINLFQENDISETEGLYPCAYETIWSVREIDGLFLLDLTLIQRSNDYIMAGYINKIQYVALQMMVAGHLNYEVGKFCHLVQNLHVYDRHLDAMNEVMNNQTLTPFPSIKLIKNKNFYNYDVSDFIILNTSKIPKLISPLEIAI